MKYFLASLSALFAFAASGAGERNAQFQLDTKAQAVRDLTPVIIYLANDIPAPLTTSGITMNATYLEAGLQGKNFYVKRELHFTEEDQDSFSSLPKEDQDFLTSVGQWVKHDTSPNAPTSDYWALRSGICRKNPKYRSALVIARNFFMIGPLKNEPLKAKVPFEHCGPDSDNDSSVVAELDASSLDPELFTYPFSEQPLSHPSFLKALLKEVAELYPPDDYRYLFIVHSSSMKDHVMSPQSPIDYLKLPIQEVRKAILARKQLFLDDSGQLKKGRGFFTALNESIFSVDTTLKPNLGISTKQFLDILENEIPDLKAPLVLLDTNQQDFTQLEKEMYDHVGTVYYTRDSNPADEAFNWRKLFSYIGITATDIEDRLRDILVGKG